MTIKDIANLAGVSPSTVSKILNHKDDHINEITRQRVLSISKEYNYEPYAGVKNNTNNFSLGVILPAFSDSALIPEVSEFLDGLSTQSQEQGYTLSILRSDNSVESERKLISLLLSRKISGLIWQPASILDKEDGSSANDLVKVHEWILTELERSKTPYLVIGNEEFPNGISIDYNLLTGRIMHQLFEHHHTTPVLITHDQRPKSKTIEKAFYQAISLSYSSANEGTVLSIDAIKNSLHQLPDKFSSLFCTNNCDAQFIYGELIKNNYRIPEDISIVTFIEGTSFVPHPVFSGITGHCKAFGQIAARTLIEMYESHTTFLNSDHVTTEYSFVKGNTLSIAAEFQKKSIITIGSINYDCTIIADRLPQSGTSLIAHSSSYSLGGKALNQAIGIAKLGQKAVLIGKIGDDNTSVRIMEGLTKCGVLCHSISRQKDTETGKAYIQVCPNGESTITVVPGANLFLSPDYVYSLEKVFQESSYCVISGEISLESIIATLDICRKHGIKTVYKPAATGYLPDSIYENIDYFIPNRYEASLLYGKEGSPADYADYFARKGCNCIIITLGSEGCFVKCKDYEQHFPACNLFHAIDNTGAADAFISAFVSFLSMGYVLSESVNIAQISAGYIVSRFGSAPSMIDLETLKNYISLKDMKE